MRTGIGYDIHRMAPGRRLVLGGVVLESPFGLVGHSDADVVLHALCDALLGAAGLPDIGELFPDSDPANKDADSRRFVAAVLTLLIERGWAVVNADVIIHAERPRLAGRKRDIQQSLAGLLGVPSDAVGVKAGTHEGLDAVGRGEAIAATVAVLLRSIGDATP